MSAMNTLKFVALCSWALSPWLAHAAPPKGDPVAGQKAFEVCAACPQVGRSARAGFGPQLNGIFGRRAGATSDYRYSPAMKHAKIVWNEQTLTALIRDPQATVPGTTMRFVSFGYSDQRIADLLAYLRTHQASTRPSP